MGFAVQTHREANFTGLVQIVKQGRIKIPEVISGSFDLMSMWIETWEIYLSGMIHILPYIHFSIVIAGREESAVGGERHGSDPARRMVLDERNIIRGGIEAQGSIRGAGDQVGSIRRKRYSLDRTGKAPEFLEQPPRRQVPQPDTAFRAIIV
jgi:hypothetical protein